MTTIEVQEFPIPDGLGEARFALPVGDGPFPAVIVLHDILGMTADLDRIVSRFADEGYVAMAPNYFGEGNKIRCVVKALRAMSRAMDSNGEGEPILIAEAAREWLDSLDYVSSGQVGVVGFCLGGGFAVLHAASADMAFVGAFYGEVPKDKERLAQLAPCFAGYGAKDAMFIKHGRRLKTHLDDLGIDNEVRIYEEAGHSYMNQLTGLLGKAAAYTPMRARYDEVASEDSWKAMLAFFSNHLDA